MKAYRSDKTVRIVRILESIRNEDETLKQVSAIILDKVEFYDRCLRSWDKPSQKYSKGEIEIGRKCCNAGLDMADSIVNELRILYTKERVGMER